MTGCTVAGFVNRRSCVLAVRHSADSGPDFQLVSIRRGRGAHVCPAGPQHKGVRDVQEAARIPESLVEGLYRRIGSCLALKWTHSLPQLHSH